MTSLANGAEVAARCCHSSCRATETHFGLHHDLAQFIDEGGLETRLVPGVSNRRRFPPIGTAAVRSAQTTFTSWASCRCRTSVSGENGAVTGLGPNGAGNHHCMIRTLLKPIQAKLRWMIVGSRRKCKRVGVLPDKFAPDCA